MIRVRADSTTTTTSAIGTKTPNVITTLMRSMRMAAIVPTNSEPMTLLKPIGYQTTASVSSRNRLMASPGDDGSAFPPGSSRIRRSMFRCSMAAFAYANAPLVRCRVNDTTMFAAARMHTIAIGHQSQSSDEPGPTVSSRSKTILAAMPGSTSTPQPRNTPERLISCRFGRKRWSFHA
jgi:hypothetical protein